MSDIGPLEYIIVGFEGNKFTGEIAPALLELVDSGLIRVVDLAVVSKDRQGHVTTLEANEVSVKVARSLTKLDGEHTGLLSEGDLMLVGDALPNDSTAAALLFEHVWATRFAKAVRKAHGRLVTSVRIPHDVVEAAQAAFVAAGGGARSGRNGKPARSRRK